MPAETLENLIDSLSIKYNRPTKKNDALREKESQEMLESLKQSKVNMEAHLDDCYMSLGELAQLQVNDVILLNRKIFEDIAVSVEGIPCYKARLGEVDSKMALRLVDAEGIFDDRKEV
jgi:flagellar motor switch protein FliM